ncbi:uncharacterized protein F54H12.2 [Trichonephila clavipes]|nr:uncharacterized protein F54H12.2 [Trichonephila clavipes]
MNLEKAYREPEQPGSFGGVEALFRATNGKFPRKDIKKWLSGKDSYTLHKPIKKKFRKNRVFVNRMNKQFQADLVDMQSLTKFNDGYRFLLTCICVLSKYAWAVPLHDKNAKTIVSAFEQIFSERIPLKLQTDADEGVSELLGFEPGEIKGKVESPYIAEPNASFPLIYVYCDLVEPQIVGDIQAPLLKIVKVEGKDGEVGYGIGGWFKRLFRSALPFLSRGAKSVGKEVLRTGAQIANDLLEGRNLQESAEERAKETGRILAKKAIKKADDMLEMAFLLKDSPECAKSELNLFALPPTQTVIERGQWVQFHPIANVSDGGPIEFVISGSGEEYLDLSQTQLYVRAKILRNDGRLITEENKVGPVNLFLHSLFSQVDISLNERIISSSSNTYAYRAIIETL